MDPTTLRLATRGSRLALVQAAAVIALLRSRHPGLSIELVAVSTRGDRQQDVPLAELRSPDGVFTRGIEEELLAGQADLAVHSLKDVPTFRDRALTLAAFPPRGEVRDALVAPRFGSLERLPLGAAVGTSSPRRTAQLLACRPDLRVVPIRGNVDTRLRKLEAGEVDALLLAGAGLERLGLADRASELLPVERFTPAVGQGTLAVQCRAEDGSTRALLQTIDDAPTRAAAAAERAFLRAVGGGCRVPVGGLGVAEQGGLTLRGFIAAPNGSDVRTDVIHGSIEEAAEIGQRLAGQILAAAGPQFLAGVHDG